jgi:O-methyltransferase
MPDPQPAAMERMTEAIGRVLEGSARFFWDAFAALKVNGITGDYAEFGCHRAGSFQAAYKAMAQHALVRHMWAFDSWQALPDDHPRDAHAGWDLGVGGVGGVDHFHEACERNGIPRAAYTTVEGYYKDTLPALGRDGRPTDIALAYIDCDLYSSTVTVLEFLAPRLKHGMIVALDDYWCWTPHDVSGERAALHEFLDAHPEWNFHRYRDIHWSGIAFVVERADALRA